MAADVMLTFDSVLPLVLSAADDCWRHLWLEEGVTCEEEEQPCSSDAQCVLRHGKTWKHIHGYFSNLEFRKCCLSLRGRPTKYNNIKLVDKDEKEIMGRLHKNLPTVQKLSDKEISVYGQALLCAQFPRLCVSTPAGSMTPEHYSYARELRTQYSASATESLSLTSDPEDASVSVIPTETLCEILRLAFGISRERAAGYERMVYEQYKKKTREKILVEELMCQLSFLENNNHPFYNSTTFLNKGAYGQWQQLQRQHIMALINKVWHFTLPPLKGSIHYDPGQFNENYRILMEKMVRFENNNRADDLGTGPVISSPLSTAALRLLKEYGLRYGVGEQYRRLVYLEYLAEHFENEVWYIQHLHSVLEGLLDGLPATYNRAVIVDAEYESFVRTSEILVGQCENSLTRIKRLFTSPKVNAAQGVACLLELLALTLRLKGFLQLDPVEPMEDLLRKYTQKCVETSYERHKWIFMTDMNLTDGNDQVTPRLASRIIISLRDEVREYRDIYSTVYDRFFDVAKLAARVLYTKLLEDVESLFKDITPYQHIKEEEILPLLALVYKLNQLDTEWSAYITLGDQVWREWVVPESLLWIDLVRKHSQQFIMQAVCADKFEPVHLKNKNRKSTGNTTRAQSTTSTATVITQSEHSAFTPIKPNLMQASSTNQTREVSPPMNLQSTLNQQKKQPKRFQGLFDKSTKMKQGLYIAKSLSSPELVRLKNYAHSIDELQSRMKSVHRRSHSDIDVLTSKDESSAFPKDDDIPKSSSILRSLPGSLGSEPNNNLMESGNFTFMKQANQSKHQTYNYTAEYNNAPNVDSSQYAWRFKPPEIQPHTGVQKRDVNIEVVAVTHYNKSSHNYVHDIEAQSSDSETDYEEVDSSYTDSSTEEDDPHGRNGGSQEAFPPLTAIETSWNGSLASLCIDVEPENNNNDVYQVAYQRNSDKHIVVQTIGKNDIENDSSPSNAFQRITKLTSQMLNVHVKRNEQLQRIKISTPASSARSTPTVHWNRSTVTTSGSYSEERKLMVSGSLVDVSCLVHRLINFVCTLCKTLCPLPVMQDLESVKDSDRNVIQALLLSRKEIYDKLQKAISLIVISYAQNILAFDLCGEAEKRAKLLVDPTLVDGVKNEFKAGHIWGCRHQQESTHCNEFVNKKAAYLADRFEPITEKMCMRLNDVWSLLGTLDKFRKEAHDAVDLDYMAEVSNRLKPSENDDVLNGYDIVDDFETSEDSEAGDSDESTHRKQEKKQDVLYEQKIQELKRIVEGLANLLAYRMNLFFTEALHLLLSINVPSVSLTGRLAPATEFLRNYLSTLNKTLYSSCYNLTVQKLWTFVVKDFEAELDDLSLINGYTTAQGKELLEVIAFYLKLFMNQAPDVDVDVFVKQTEDVCEQLQLHTLSTKHLLQHHKRLQQLRDWATKYEDGDCFLTKECIDTMRKHLHAQRKTFNGATLVQFIKANKHMFRIAETNLDEDVLDSRAETFAQRMLDTGIIVCNDQPVQASHPSNSLSASVGSLSPYPAMGIYSTSYTASIHTHDALAQYIYRKNSKPVIERVMVSENGDSLTFGNHVEVSIPVKSARKIIERRKTSWLKKEKNALSKSLPDLLSEPSVLMFNTSNPNGVLSQSVDGAVLLDDGADDPLLEIPTSERNGNQSDANRFDTLDVSGTTTRATTASPSVVSTDSLSNGAFFQNTTDKFYRFAGQFDELLFDLDTEGSSEEQQSMQYSESLNQSAEMNGLRYKEKTVTADLILSILNTRKGVDPEARCYLQSLPEHMLSAAHVIAHHPTTISCFGFISKQ